MNEHYVTSLEWSKRLKKAGVEEKAEYWWEFDGLDEYKLVSEKEKLLHQVNGSYSRQRFYAAYLTDELAGMLPPSLTSDDVGEPQEYGSTWLTIEKDRKNWVVSYENSNHQMFIEQQVGYTLPNALAAMVEYLRKEKIV